MNMAARAGEQSRIPANRSNKPRAAACRLSVRRFRPEPGNLYICVCVKDEGRKLQLSVRAYHSGIHITFPPMDRREIVRRWMQSVYCCTGRDTTVDLLFDAAFLRIVPDVLSFEEVGALMTEWKQDVNA